MKTRFSGARRALSAGIALTLAIGAMVGLTGNVAAGATTPDLGMATSFGILAGTYTNTAPGTTINGNLGYTTGPLVAATVNGTTHPADGMYAQAGIDQGNALTALNAQPCSFTFAPGAIDLATDVTHGVIRVYAPGVYCVTGAASVGAAGIVLTGSGTYIFRIVGALTTVAGSVVSSASGASPCDVFWTPTAATTLAANTTFFGTDIDAAGITIGDTILWTGRALAFGGTVSTVRDTITAPSCGGGGGGGGVGGSVTTFDQVCINNTLIQRTFVNGVAVAQTPIGPCTSGPFFFTGTATPVPSIAPAVMATPAPSTATPAPSTATPAPSTATPAPSASPAVVVVPAPFGLLPSTATDENALGFLILPLVIIGFLVLYLVARARRRRARPAA